MLTDLGYKIFFMFGAINVVAMGLFSWFIPETKGRSLEEMDIIFGSISAEDRAANIERQTHADEKDTHSSLDRKDVEQKA